ncbi:DciA family protein [Xenophilus sp. Marseille-Q4582]|uniref:DciA family protein n=1 Tax=Xenophilus sp. Marseille-Q4582 TaxID=2866600 RepID=UPI001CE46D9C|nr:DciA family protein [Xenophilus sp. Marseille-Q4582]
MSRRSQAFTLLQASEESPTLAGLMARARDSQARLQAITPLLPPALRAAVAAGPTEDGEWCLLVEGNAVAAKLRQMVPMLLARLRVQGWDAQSIRIKVRTRTGG